MLAWVKALIKLRRSRVCFNDGDMHRVLVSADDKKPSLLMQRDEARIVVNFGKRPYAITLLEGEELVLISRSGLEARHNRLDLPPMTMAVLLSSTEESENRQVVSDTR